MKDLSWLQHNLIAHRGLYTKDQQIPENTIAAFQNALNHGYTIEIDVNLLKDGTVVSYHDPTLKRLFNEEIPLSELTFEDIQTYRFSGGEGIPSLDEVLQFVNGKVPLLIELKPFGDVKTLCHQVMKVLQNYTGSYALFSFHPRVVYCLKKHYPHVIRGQIAETYKTNKRLNFIVKWLLRTMVFNLFTKPDFISYWIHDLPLKRLDKLKAKGMTIISYAAQNQAEFSMVKKHYHNVVFEFFHPKIK